MYSIMYVLFHKYNKYSVRTLSYANILYVLYMYNILYVLFHMYKRYSVRTLSYANILYVLFCMYYIMHVFFHM